jgi:hypothetical protein
LYKENYSENVFHRDNLQKVHTEVEFLPQTIHLKDKVEHKSLRHFEQKIMIFNIY